MKVDTVSSLSILIVRFAVVSEKMTLPSGSAMVPSLPLKPSLMTWTFAPAATTPGMAVATVSVAGGWAPPALPIRDQRRTTDTRRQEAPSNFM